MIDVICKQAQNNKQAHTTNPVSYACNNNNKLYLHDYNKSITVLQKLHLTRTWDSFACCARYFL